MKGFRLFAVVVLASLAVLAITQTVLAGGGPEYTYGSYINGTVKYYTNSRYVDDPALPGPEVAFYLTTSSASDVLMLGTSHCGSGYDGPIYFQYDDGYYHPVAYFSAPRAFCIVTYGNGGSGSFEGDIAWDQD